MNTLTQTIFVNRPIDEAFDFCINNEFFDRWMPGVFASKLDADEPLRLGSTFKQDVMIGKKMEKITAQVMVFEPNAKWSYVGRAGNTFFRRTWVFETLSKGTKIHYIEETTPQNSGVSAFAPLTKFFAKEPVVDVMRSLKRDLESKGRYLPELV
jgi:hypothetical protein